uniref:Galectin n=1 Tax=Heliothis virescens TaxID=7102 RepID=A0A2A4JJQ1_HELVI
MVSRQSVYVPEMPCVHKMAATITSGTKIRIQATTPPTADRFWIDFQCGVSVSRYVDVAFHLNPRFDDKSVVLNSLIDETWGMEERNRLMYLYRGAVFDMLIECHEQLWKVSINGQHFCQFAHRIQFQRITHLAAYGHVNIIKCNLESGSFAFPLPSEPGTPEMQCIYKIAGGISDSSMVKIHGIVPPHAYRFRIDFQCGLSAARNDDIAFHLNPRFDEMEVVRNTQIAQKWGREERSPSPLRRGEVFDMLIMCDSQYWKVIINGQFFCQFPHRIQFQRITHLVVSGDVNITMINT